MAQITKMVTINVEELAGMLESLIRRVVREELARLVTQEPDVFYIEPDSPLYEDMVEILRRRERGEIKLYSHDEVWGE
jgi:hypothetical protein